MKTTIITLYGFNIKLNIEDKVGNIETDLWQLWADQKENSSDILTMKLRVAINTLESLILSQAIEGIEVSSSAYLESLKTTLGKIMSTYCE